MPRAVALKLHAQSALAVVARPTSRGIAVEAVVRVPLAEGDAPQAVGQKIAAALAAHSAGRAATVVAVPRSDLHWQNYELPPAPVADLPDLVQLQVQRDIVLADDGVGFDFLSLHGDEEHPHRVLGFGVTTSQLDRMRTACTEADLKLQRVIPEAFGWMELGRRAAEATPSDAPLTVFAAVAGRQAAVWATQDDELRLLRTVWLAPEADSEADLAALAGELRRTLVSLSQMANAPSASLPCVFLGADGDTTAAQLSATLSRPLRGARLDATLELPESFDGSLSEIAPLAALAAAVAADRALPVDLLHPHRPPAPPSRKRTFSLAGAAGASVALLGVWVGYQSLQAPLTAAAQANAAKTALEPTLARFAEDEKKAAAVDAWLAQTPNLLTELDHLAQQLRPLPLDNAEFKADEDVVINKLTLAGQQLSIDAVARSTDALQPIERRLRAGDYRVSRGVVDPKSEATPGYSIGVANVLERIASAPTAASTPTATAPVTTAAPATSTPPAVDAPETDASADDESAAKTEKAQEAEPQPTEAKATEESAADESSAEDSAAEGEATEGQATEDGPAEDSAKEDSAAEAKP